MIIICLRNMVSCRGNRDAIFHIKISRNLLLLEFSCQNELIIVVKCSELRLAY